MQTPHEFTQRAVPVPDQGTHRLRRRGWLIRRALLLADLLGLAGSFLATNAIFDSPTSSGMVSATDETFLFLATLPFWPFVAKLYGLYDSDEERTDHSTADDVVRLFHVVTIGVWLLSVVSWIAHVARPEMPKLSFFWALTIALMVSGRSLARTICRRTEGYVQRTVIIGTDEVGRTVARKLRAHPEYRIEVVGFVDATNADPSELDMPYLGDLTELDNLIERESIERLIVSFTGETPEATLDFVRQWSTHDVQIDIVPRLFPVMSRRVGIHSVEGLTLVGLRPFRLGSSSLLVKRIVDVALAALGLTVLLPVFAATALAIKLDSPGPVFYRQERMGRGSQTFRIFKFRTMVDGADHLKHTLEHLNVYADDAAPARMFKVEGDPRVTRTGRILRRRFVDELPQLLNVLIGDMSLVGPRPLILPEDAHVRDWARRRLDLRPGMTGLWQVMGRNSISFEEMVALDYVYVTSWSLGEDLRIIGKTIPLMIGGAGGRL